MLIIISFQHNIVKSHRLNLNFTPLIIENFLSASLGSAQCTLLTTEHSNHYTHSKTHTQSSHAHS